jgi:AraC family transcriptional regulator
VTLTATTLLRTDLIEVVDVLCAAGPDAPAVMEHHRHHSLAFVRAGSFACRCAREDFDLVRGSVLVGAPGRSFTCSHIHHPHGDRCLSVQVAPGAIDQLGDAAWEIGTLAPTAELPVLGRLIETRARQRDRFGLEEAAFLAIARFRTLGRGRSARRAPNLRERRLAVSAALWLEAHAGEEASLGGAASQAGLSPFHFLRIFSRDPRRHAAPVPAAGAAGPGGGAAGRDGAPRHGSGVRGRLCRPLQFRPFLRPGGRYVAPCVSRRGPQESPSSRGERDLSLPSQRGGTAMYDHVGLKVRDTAAAVKFYAAIMGALGHKPIAEDGTGYGAGAGAGAASLWLSEDSKAPGGAHVAFTAADHKTVQRFHTAGLAAGGKDNGPPGPRPNYGPTYYAAFLIDPDGNNVEAVCMKAD